MTGQATRHPVDAWLVGVGAVVGTVAIVAAAPKAVEGNPTVDVVAQVLLALAIGLGILVVALRLSPNVTGFLIALLMGLFLCGGGAIILNATPFAPLGAVADQSYRTAYITKFAHHWSLVDYDYKGLPSFYPPLFFWVLGRASALLGIAAWKMLKVGTLATAFLVPVAGWFLWRPMVGPRRAAAVVVLTSLVVQEWYVPHLWLATAIFVPWWCRYVLGAGRAAPLTRVQIATGIALGTVATLMYWYVALIAVVHLVLLLALRPVFRRNRWQPEPPRLREMWFVLGGTAVLTAVFWLPLAVSALTTPGAQTMQNRYFPSDQVPLPLDFLTFDVKGVVLLFGLVALAATASRNRLSLHLLGIVVAGYVVYLLGYLGFLGDNPLGTGHTPVIIDFCLAAGAALGVLELARVLIVERRVSWIDTRSAVGVVVAMVLAVTFALGQNAVRDMPFLKEQRSTRYPTALIRNFERATHGKYAEKIVLTDITDLPSYLPVYVFNTSDAHYSHPAALFNDRADLLKKLTYEDDPDLFALALMHNRYDTIDYVALRNSGGGFSYDYLADAFPVGVASVSLTFPERLFDSRAFTKVGNGPVTTFRVNHDDDLLRPLRNCPQQPSAPKCDVLRPLLTRYSPHLDDDARKLAKAWETASAER
jgi:hypothetical protein